MPQPAVAFSVKDGVGHVVLNRPERANSINSKTARELMAIAIQCDEDPDVRAVLIRSRGPMFSGGGDLKTFSSRQGDLPAYLKETTTFLHAAISRLVRQSAPTVCAVHGFAAGGGFSLAISCDMVIAARSAKFTMAYTRAGLTPDGSSSYFLPRLVGLRRAIELTLTNRVLTADEALEWGLISTVVPDSELGPQSERLAARLASGPTSAFGAAKRLLQEGFARPLEAQMEIESRAIADAVRGHDAREGIRAFLEKRKPRFKGK